MRRRYSRVTSVQNGPIRVNPAFTWPVQFGAGLALLVNWPGFARFTRNDPVSPDFARQFWSFRVKPANSGPFRVKPGQSGSGFSTSIRVIPDQTGPFRVKPSQSGSGRLWPGFHAVSWHGRKGKLYREQKNQRTQEARGESTIVLYCIVFTRLTATQREMKPNNTGEKKAKNTEGKQIK